MRLGSNLPRLSGWDSRTGSIVCAVALAVVLGVITIATAACSTPEPTSTIDAGSYAFVTPDIGLPFRGPVVVGAMRDVESTVVAELYAQTLQAAGFDVMRQYNFSSPTEVSEALLGGHVDLYPERPSVAAYSVLGLSTPHWPSGAPAVDDVYPSVVEAYELFNVVWLERIGDGGSTGENDQFAPLVREEVLEFFPDLAAELDGLSAILTPDDLIVLVAQVTDERREPIEVVASYLEGRAAANP